jgi:hypothetical protein
MSCFNAISGPYSLASNSLPCSQWPSISYWILCQHSILNLIALSSQKTQIKHVKFFKITLNFFLEEKYKRSKSYGKVLEKVGKKSNIVWYLRHVLCIHSLFLFFYNYFAFYLFFFYHFYIYSHVYTAFGSPLPCSPPFPISYIFFFIHEIK